MGEQLNKMPVPEHLENLAEKLRKELKVESIKFVTNPIDFKKAVADKEAVCFYDPITKIVACKYKGNLHIFREQDL